MERLRYDSADKEALIEKINEIVDLLNGSMAEQKPDSSRVYREAWDFNGKVFRGMKEALQDMRRRQSEAVLVCLTEAELVDVLTTYAHFRAAEARKPEHQDYWKDKIHVKPER